MSSVKQQINKSYDRRSDPYWNNIPQRAGTQIQDGLWPQGSVQTFIIVKGNVQNQLIHTLLHEPS